MKKIALTKFAFHCLCGVSCTGTASPLRLAITQLQWEKHYAEGCAPCDANTAARIRRNQRRKSDREAAGTGDMFKLPRGGGK